MQHQLLVQILATLDGDHNATIFDMVVQTLRSQEPTHICHQMSILNRIPDLLDLLSEWASSPLASGVVKAASSTYESELRGLISKQSGFHFSGNKASLSQLEDFSITQMGWKIQDLAPNLWTLLGSLLDVEPTRRRTAPAEEVVDEDIEIELPNIATAVNRNENGSSDLDGEDGEVEAAATSDDVEMQHLDTTEKSGYRKHNRAQQNAALMYIVSIMLTDAKSLQTYLDI